jgi:hypothetical protein
MNCAFGYTLNLPKTLIKIGAWAFNGPAFRFTRINSLYDMQPNFGSQSFGGWQNLVGPTRTVVNESETYTSQEFYDYLKTRGLDAGWQPSD